MTFPTPSHLVNCTARLAEQSDGHHYAGHVVCPCGHDIVVLKHTGETHDWDGQTVPCTAQIDGEFFFRVTATCENCKAEILLLDMDLHGWNGFVCRDASADRPRPTLVPWQCQDCGAMTHTADVVVQGEDKRDAIEESDGILNDENWQEGFGWFTIDIQCSACEKRTQSWVSLETM